MLRREPIRLRGRLVFHNAAADHRAQPLAHIAFNETGPLSDC